MDIRIVEMVCSRLCHDLVSPVGAIHNGVELIEEMEDEPAGGFMGEAVKLIAHSATQADRRLRLFRLAYGMAGREARSFEETREVLTSWLDGSRTRLDWVPGAVPNMAAGRNGVAKVLINTVMLADEALTHGGTIAVAGQGDDTGGQATVTATGRPGVLNREAAAALAGKSDAAGLTPRTVHAFLTGRFAEAFDIRLTSAPAGQDMLVFTMVW